MIVTLDNETVVIAFFAIVSWAYLTFYLIVDQYTFNKKQRDLAKRLERLEEFQNQQVTFNGYITNYIDNLPKVIETSCLLPDLTMLNYVFTQLEKAGVIYIPGDTKKEKDNSILEIYKSLNPDRAHYLEIKGEAASSNNDQPHD